LESGKQVWLRGKKMGFVNFIKEKKRAFDEKANERRKATMLREQQEAVLLRARNKELAMRLKAKKELEKEQAIADKQRKELFARSTAGKITAFAKKTASDFQKKQSAKNKKASTPKKTVVRKVIITTSTPKEAPAIEKKEFKFKI
jgi:hypothetical protein